MTAPDGRLAALRGQAREWGAGFAAAALDLDRDPDRIADHLDLPGVRFMGTFGVPAEFGRPPLRIGPHRFEGTTALERAVVLEELARGDIGMTLAAPGPSMSGVLVEQLGDRAQREWFYGRVLAEPTWTCFALTEPDRGSDASALDTALRPAGDGALELTGAKRYVGNASRARIAAVFARTRPGPLGVTAVLVDTGDPGYRAEPLGSLGVRGARICAVTLDRVRVDPERVLGRHLSPTRRGIWASVQVFNRLRPSVAALALGVAGAAHDLLLEHRAAARGAARERIERIGRRIGATRALVHRAAAAVDATGDGYLASAAKARACRLAEEVTLEAAELLAPAARATHPLLDKLVRDARGVEFMEGTRNIQHLNLFQGLLSGRVDG
ncbi:alkylation response protein AidB-like acyl-CoA dehydrogenase [Kitasatospora sp. SolWspMP-SS2h]|uniref:acyl-CoA dehydrogenase family protein n=1 Tax=Kitasatospora sp. SolWspMP-SS2h TaxID=1305729 RepID=UPI000DB97F64|nr:acyl-CoA dehydrogenase family protein [Kitasatospora sp. SolWspMP-SS2h]RAJ43045.1 alkylation response protein AidB-like acyl-CoA dehydrogenase [Kitasatospora sp. SolWspMP-SS2h]